MPELTLTELKIAAKDFAHEHNNQPIPKLFDTRDGKTVGTYVEQAFRKYLGERYHFVWGNSARGIDFPELGIDIKTTSTKQPQSSSPFRSANQKVYGLGYHLLIFEYETREHPGVSTAKLHIRSITFLEKERTADYETTSGILRIIQRNGNADDIVALLEEHKLPLEKTDLRPLAELILKDPPKIGYLTISNALQWRLQYKRAIGFSVSGNTEGVERLDI